MPDDIPTADTFESGTLKMDEIPDLQPLDEDRVANIISQEISDAETFRGTTITHEQADALDYYYGRPLGNEVEDRSQVILTDVRDTIEWIMPTLMKLFFGSRSVIRYVPREEGDIDWARQCTKYAQYLIRSGNTGFMLFHDWFKDALLEKLGVVTVFFEEKERKELERYAQLTQEEMDALLSEEGVELVGYEESTRTVPALEAVEEAGAPPVTPGPMPPGAPEMMPQMPMPPEVPEEPEEPEEISEFDVHIRRITPQRSIRMVGVPQEEFLVAARARVVDDDCPFVARRLRVTYSDLVGMGIPRDIIDNLPANEGIEYSRNYTERREDESSVPHQSYDRQDWASRETWLTECYIRIDEDGDGYAELRRILVAGDTGLKILEDDEATHIPFATLCPVPVPHKLYGLSWADLIMDLQRIRSTLLRQILDNVYLTNNQRYAVVEGEVEIEDLLTTSPGGVVRMTAPNMVEPLAQTPLGPGALSMMEYLHGVKEDRTGITRYNQGSDASSLNQTATGISAIMEAANLRIEMIARIFAETGVKRLFEQLLYVMRENPIKDEVLRITDDEWVEMNPEMWKANLDVEVEVGLGTSQSAVRVDNMMMLHDLQQRVMQFDGRMVSPENAYAVLERIPEAMGFSTEGLFFNKPDFDEDPPAPDPDPKLLEVQMQQEIEKAKIQIELDTLQFRRDQAMLEKQMKDDELETRVTVARIQALSLVQQAEINAHQKTQSDMTRAGTDLVKTEMTTTARSRKE